MDYSRFTDSNAVNWYESDYTMKRYVQRYLSPALKEWGEEQLVQMGAYAAGPMDERARHTDREGAPQLLRYDRYGNEINEVWYNEGYRTTVAEGFRSGVVGWRYREDVPEPIPFFFTQLLHMLMSGAETGFTCPVTLTMSVAFVIEKFGNDEQKKKFLPRLAAMDPEQLMQGATFLTEIEGGSDVGATQTTAVKDGDRWLLTGEKWFASNCDGDVSITLARISDAPGTKGLGLFLMPRVLDDGSKNHITIRRLKDKLGVRAVASGELELHGAEAELIGEPDKGFKYMAEALNVSRMCTATGSLAMSRRAYLEAIIHASRRSAFGHLLKDFPMIQQTLLDIMTDIEAGWALAAQMMQGMDRCHTEGHETLEELTRLRLLLAMAKYRLSENSVAHAKQALELLGGNGYIEDFVTPRLLRDAQVSTVWEGPSNIMALEVLKILAREAKQCEGEGILFSEMKRTLAEVDRPELADASQCIDKKRKELFLDVRYLLAADAMVQNAHARTFLDQLTHVYTGIRLLKEAQMDLEESGDDRLARIAEYYVDRTFRPEVHSIRSETIPAMDLFEQVVLRHSKPSQSIGS
ncbi:acyl-CoA dehydrogenase family protein [Marininema halotolerans]|uniref:Acyl-CoA dehydrogenase n=1 Tax=Marininema halotolerans TaxID=1155944 RepID=A0A1I6SWC1_9BACL|nr:acyl-CoA dehydrogenase family protein [Marininema halotolerans]SFS81088.1 Acyl-CoA dehydrogenase [Marininema halotolerans]